VVRFRDRPPEGLRVSAENLRLHCTPIVNLLAKDADPIRLDQRRSSYLVRPADPEPDHFEVYSVEKVTGLVPGSRRRVEYRPFYAFRHGRDEGDGAYYKLQRRAAAGRENSDCHLAFVTASDRSTVPDLEIVSVELVCTNRRLAESLKPGDVCRHTDRSPQVAEFRNIAPVTPSVVPPLGGDFHWRLISHLTLNMTSLASAPALRALLSLYDFLALHDRQAAAATERQLDAIRDVRMRPAERLFRGAVLRGIDTTITLQEDRFTSEGELYLFAGVLEEFLSLYVTVNAFSRLTVVGAQKGERYEWRPRVGTQFTL
jgi:type VI secretion system protein ImpG